MARYALTDDTGNIINVVEWDGQTPFDPPGVAEKVKVPEGVPAEPGGRYKKPTGKGKPEWVRAPRPEADGEE